MLIVLRCASLALPNGVPEVIAGRYRLLNVLRANPKSTVYEAEFIVLGEVLALKVFWNVDHSAESLADLIQSARRASRILGDHVERILDIGVAPEFDGAVYVVTEMLRGEDLEQVSKNKPIGHATAVTWLRQVASTLDEAHRLGIVHGNLSPQSIFLTRRADGVDGIKILDLGIVESFAKSSDGSFPNLPRPMYMARELLLGRREPTIDRYALALIAYKLLIGVSYWTGNSDVEIFSKTLRRPLESPSGRHSFGPAFDAWFLRACDIDPNVRFGSAVEEVESLAEAVGLPPVGSMQGEHPPSTMPGRMVRRSQIVLSAQHASAPPDAGPVLTVLPSSTSGMEVETPESVRERQRLAALEGAAALALLNDEADQWQRKHAPELIGHYLTTLDYVEANRRHWKRSHELLPKIEAAAHAYKWRSRLAKVASVLTMVLGSAVAEVTRRMAKMNDDPSTAGTVLAAGAIVAYAVKALFKPSFIDVNGERAKLWKKQLDALRASLPPVPEQEARD